MDALYRHPVVVVAFQLVTVSGVYVINFKCKQSGMSKRAADKLLISPCFDNNSTKKDES